MGNGYNLDGNRMSKVTANFKLLDIVHGYKVVT